MVEFKNLVDRIYGRHQVSPSVNTTLVQCIASKPRVMITFLRTT